MIAARKYCGEDLCILVRVVGSEIFPHFFLQCSVKSLNDAGFGFIIGSEEVDIRFLEKRLKLVIDKFGTLIGLEQTRLSPSF